jgi:tRNA threonylcarbamoyl adenosine modification protein YeaZ
MTEPRTGLTLAVTSSTGVMSLALGLVDRVGDSQPVSVLCDVTVATERRHAEELIPQVQRLVADAGFTVGHLDRLMVDVGPGRFTGLRVGLATVRALAFSLGRPVVPLTSLAVLAASAPRPQTDADVDPGTVTAVIDARRSEVFQQTFVDGEPQSEPVVIAPEDGAKSAAGVVVGDGLDRYVDLYREAADAASLVVEGVHLTAVAMLGLGQGVAARPGTEITPLYLRDPDAVPNIRTRVADDRVPAGGTL